MQAQTLRKLGILFALLCMAIICFVGLWQSDIYPGIHFDEAWAANYAYKIAYRSDYWPWMGMNAYTFPWAHYVAAVWYQIFGTSLLTYKFSQITLNIGGIALCFLAIQKRYGSRVGNIWLALVGASLPLALNQRFAIELTGFHVFCFGLLCFGFVYQKLWILLVGCFLGITSHMLFLAPALAFFLCSLRAGITVRKQPIFILLLSLLPVFLYTYLELHFSAKGLALILLDLISMALLFWPLPQKFLIAQTKLEKKLLPLLSSAGLISLFFFSFGVWSITITQGYVARPLFLFVPVLVVMLLWINSLWNKKSIDPVFLAFFFFTLVVTSLIVPKPTVRYFEIPLLLLALLWAQTLAPYSKKMLLSLWVLGLTGMATNLEKNYFQTESRERDLRFLLWTDSSRDFLDKQSLVQYLSLNGCQLSDIASGDARLLEELRFLAISDWPPSKQACRWHKLRIERKEFRVENQLDFRVADFYLLADHE